MKKIILCGNPNGGCCPSVEKSKNDGITITDEELRQKIIFTKKQAQELAWYLCKNGYCKR